MFHVKWENVKWGLAVGEGPQTTFIIILPKHFLGILWVAPKVSTTEMDDGERKNIINMKRS